MVNGNIGMSDPSILDSIRKHQFCAVVEVTNGITNFSTRQKKKSQIKKIKRNLRKALGDSPYIIGGLALIKSQVDEIRELDFFMKVGNYNMFNLECAVLDVLGSRMIGRKDKNFLEYLMNLAEKSRYHTIRSLLNPADYMLRRLSKQTRAEYKKHLPIIKGAVLEIYVRNLFEEAFTDSYDVTVRNHIWDKNKKEREKWQTEADLIIATPERNFRDALETIVRNYPSGQQKITVTYPNGF